MYLIFIYIYILFDIYISIKYIFYLPDKKKYYVTSSYVTFHGRSEKNRYYICVNSYVSGLSLVNDMLTPAQLPPQKQPYWHKRCAMCLKLRKNNFLIFVILIFREKCVKWPNYFLVPEDAQCSETVTSLILTVLQFLIFEMWSIFYSKFLVNWGLVTKKKILFCLLSANSSVRGGLSHPYPPPEAPPPGLGCLWIKFPQPTGYWVSLVAVFKFV